MGVVEGIFQLLGSLGLFLYGMKVMSDGLQKSSGDRLQKTLRFMTKNRFAGVATGIGVTSVIQSSSATTVMVVSFVSAGMLSLTQSIGVIMGANIGTTVTAWIVSLFGFKMKITALALPAIGLALPLIFIKKFRKETFGEFLIGFGILFLGLYYLKECMPAVDGDSQAIKDFVASITGGGLISRLAFVCFGMVLTVIVQSSSATVAITQTMAFQGWLDFESAVSIVLGENIGTTITAQIASVGCSLDAKRAAMVHTMFNVFGVVWVVSIFPIFVKVVDSLYPGSRSLLGEATSDNVNITAGIALFHTLFNVTNTFILIWFVTPFERLIRHMLPGRRIRTDDGVYRLRYFSASLQDTPDMSIVRARQEVQKMAAIVENMFTKFITLFYSREIDIEKDVKEFAKNEEFTDQMQSEISRFLGECSRYNLSTSNMTSVAILVRVIDELESIADSCYHLVLLEQKCREKKFMYHTEALEATRPYTNLIREFLSLIARYLDSSMSQYELDEAKKMEDQINNYRNLLKRAARKRIEEGGSVSGEILFIDELQQMEHIGDFAFNIARALSGVGIYPVR
ncbi:MAG: Na/Pi cotransporter family protein [Spirochaetota bacterium]|jgi:phosphate:Na+ symporter|nr:Na/Pi cotransporter family protein [Spirochaetota bacterium]